MDYVHISGQYKVDRAFSHDCVFQCLHLSYTLTLKSKNTISASLNMPKTVQTYEILYLVTVGRWSYSIAYQLHFQHLQNSGLIVTQQNLNKFVAGISTKVD